MCGIDRRRIAPFQGLVVARTGPQGVALGFHIAPRWGEERALAPRWSYSPSPCEGEGLMAAAGHTDFRAELCRFFYRQARPGVAKSHMAISPYCCRRKCPF
jgi:hypothetical protein